MIFILLGIIGDRGEKIRQNFALKMPMKWLERLITIRGQILTVECSTGIHWRKIQWSTIIEEGFKGEVELEGWIEFF